MAVEDILNGQRSTTAMGIEICFTHANPANPAKGLEQFREIRGISVRLPPPFHRKCYRGTDPYTQKQQITYSL